MISADLFQLAAWLKDPPKEMAKASLLFNSACQIVPDVSQNLCQAFFVLLCCTRHALRVTLHKRSRLSVMFAELMGVGAKAYLGLPLSKGTD